MKAYKEEDTTVDRKALVVLLRESYGVAVESLTYVPAGECSHAYVADSNRGLLFVKVYQRAPDGRAWNISVLHARLSALAGLRSIPGIVAPHATVDGQNLVSSREGPVAVFPYIPAVWTDPDCRSDDDIDRAARLLAGIHSCRDGAVITPLQPLGDSLDIPYADNLQQLMTMVDGSGTESADSPIHALLRRHRRDILNALERLNVLAAELRRAHVDLVVTHGDPHHASLLRAPDGSLHLIDWDDIALGPVERDLVFFSGPRFKSFWRYYAEIRPVPLREEAINFYLWHWTLQEIADYGMRLVRGGMSNTETQRAQRELIQYVPLRTEEIPAAAHAMMSAATLR